MIDELLPELLRGPEALAVLWSRLLALFGFGEAPVRALALVFARVAAVSALLPGFGERALPARVKLAVALAFTAVVWPAVAPTVSAALPAPPGDPRGPALAIPALAGALVAEAATGLVIGLAVRLLVMALQTAGSIAAQSTAVAQILGPGVTPDPMPAIGGILTVAGIALAMALGLHVKAAAALVGSYSVVPPGQLPPAGDAAALITARAADAFALALALAAPFAVAAFVYNLALGALNRAMPQLMVAFVGAPAITGIALLILVLAAPEILSVWHDRLDGALADPFRSP